MWQRIRPRSSAAGPVTLESGTFPDTIRVQEFNPLDGDKGDKVYAAGVGLIMDGTLALKCGVGLMSVPAC